MQPLTTHIDLTTGAALLDAVSQPLWFYDPSQCRNLWGNRWVLLLLLYFAAAAAAAAG